MNRTPLNPDRDHEDRVRAEFTDDRGSASALEVRRRQFLGGTVAAGVASLSLAAGPIRAAVADNAVAATGLNTWRNQRDMSEEIAEFVVKLQFEDIPHDTVAEIKRRLLDTLGCAIAAVDEKEVRTIRRAIMPLDSGTCTLWGSRQYASPPDAALLNTAMIRVLDYNDTYAGPHGGGHPSNAIGAIIAAAQVSGATTREVITAIAVCYELLGAFADVLNTRVHGLDHLGYVGVSIAAAVGKALRLDKEQLRQSLGIMVATYNPLHVTLAEQITSWKGVATAYGAMNAMHACLLGRAGMVGPSRPFNGNKGWLEVVARQNIPLELTAGERVHGILTKLYLAETYALSAAEGAIEFSREHDVHPQDIESIHLQSFSNATSRIGVTATRDPYTVRNKPEADHSFPYIIAVAIIDRELTHAQYEQTRIERDDVQTLLRKVQVSENPEFNRIFRDGRSPFPALMDIRMTDGRRFTVRKDYFSGHAKKPATTAQIMDKLAWITDGHIEATELERLGNLISDIENRDLAELVALLSPPVVQADDEFDALFDGHSLDGWYGDPRYWSIRDGAITGSSDDALKETTNLISREHYRDFELTLQYRFTSPSGNSGVIYRGAVTDASHYKLDGYQANIVTPDGGSRFGFLFHQQGERRHVLALLGERTVIESGAGGELTKRVTGKTTDADAALESVTEYPGWNTCRIIVQGDRYIHRVNGHETVDVIDRRGVAREGPIALQLHEGAPMGVQFRDIRVRRLADNDGTET